MKYVLGLLFEYEYYKNPANIKIFSNNQLIDEIDLTEDIKIKNNKEFVSKREEILSMIWDMEEEIMGKDI